MSTVALVLASAKSTTNAPAAAVAATAAAVVAPVPRANGRVRDRDPGRQQAVSPGAPHNSLRPKHRHGVSDPLAPSVRRRLRLLVFAPSTVGHLAAGLAEKVLRPRSSKQPAIGRRPGARSIPSRPARVNTARSIGTNPKEPARANPRVGEGPAPAGKAKAPGDQVCGAQHPAADSTFEVAHLHLQRRSATGMICAKGAS